jgi:hypothetical protein
MVIAMTCPNGGITTITTKGGVEFRSIRTASIGPCEILRWDNKGISIKNCTNIRLIADVKLATGAFVLQAVGFQSVMWIRPFDDDLNGPPEFGIEHDGTKEYVIFSKVEEGTFKDQPIEPQCA